MLTNLTFHHIGYVTDDIAQTAAFYLKTGYEATDIITDEIQQVKICFLSKADFPLIELIEPNNEKAALNKILKKNGVAPYHVCYETDDINLAFDKFTEEYGFIPLFRPVEAIALNNRLICYLYKKEVGFIELVNKT